jgi:hypothetical protein
VGIAMGLGVALVEAYRSLEAEAIGQLAKIPAA